VFGLELDRRLRAAGRPIRSVLAHPGYSATDPNARSGEFYGPNGLGEGRGYPTIVTPVPAATDHELGRRLWELSEQLTGVSYL